MKKTKLPDNLPPNLPPNVRVVTLDELKRLSMRLQKVTNFNFTGAILCLIAGLYYAKAGSTLLPKVFIVIMVGTLLMTILSYRASHKVSKVLDILSKKTRK